MKEDRYNMPKPAREPKQKKLSLAAIEFAYNVPFCGFPRYL
jgi:hypothetical protein